MLSRGASKRSTSNDAGPGTTGIGTTQPDHQSLPAGQGPGSSTDQNVPAASHPPRPGTGLLLKLEADPVRRPMNEIIIGLDPHKLSNTIAVLDRDENVLGRRQCDNDAGGLTALLDAVVDYPDRVWAVEGANGIGRSIAQRLVAVDERVVDVLAKLATRVRVYSTGHGNKTNDTDALAIARAAIHSKASAFRATRRRQRRTRVAVGPTL